METSKNGFQSVLQRFDRLGRKARTGELSSALRVGNAYEDRIVIRFLMAKKAKAE